MSRKHIEQPEATRSVTATANSGVTPLFALCLGFPHVRLNGRRTLWEQKVPGSSPGAPTRSIGPPKVFEPIRPGLEHRSIQRKVAWLSTIQNPTGHGLPKKSARGAGKSLLAGDDNPYLRMKRKKFLGRFLDAKDFRSKIVLEVGCGPGGNLLRIAQRSSPKKLIGVDISLPISPLTKLLASGAIQ